MIRRIFPYQTCKMNSKQNHGWRNKKFPQKVNPDNEKRESRWNHLLTPT